MNEQAVNAVIVKDIKSGQTFINLILFVIVALCFGIAIASNTGYESKDQTNIKVFMSCGAKFALKQASKDAPPSGNGSGCPHQSYSQGIIANATSQKNRLFQLKSCCLT